jgi:hypothetical protein
MSTFQPGSNRARVYELLNSKPKNKKVIANTLGLKETAVDSVLGQITQLGYAVPVGKENGLQYFIRGDGKPRKPTRSESTSRREYSDKLEKFFKSNVGNTLTIAEMAKSMKLKSPGSLSNRCKKMAGKGELTVVNTGTPIQYRIEPSTTEGTQTELIPSTPPPAITPEMMTPMATSDAIGQLMQIESQNIVYRQALHQMAAIYEQLGNVLEMAGLLEED